MEPRILSKALYMRHLWTSESVWRGAQEGSAFLAISSSKSAPNKDERGNPAVSSSKSAPNKDERGKMAVSSLFSGPNKDESPRWSLSC